MTEDVNGREDLHEGGLDGEKTPHKADNPNDQGDQVRVEETLETNLPTTCSTELRIPKNPGEGGLMTTEKGEDKTEKGEFTFNFRKRKRVETSPMRMDEENWDRPKDKKQKQEKDVVNKVREICDDR